MIENNFELMNGNTIQVTSDPMKVPKFFLRLDNMKALKEAVAIEMDQATMNQGVAQGSILGKRQALEDNEQLQRVVQYEDSKYSMHQTL
jgi:hypothetical protein